MESLYNLEKKDFIELAKLSSFIHKKEHYDDFKYIGWRFKYLTLNVPELIRKHPNVKFLVVLIKANKLNKKHGQLDRLFIYNSFLRNCFELYNINNNELIQVDIMQDNLFDMFEYLKSIKSCQNQSKSTVL